MAKRSGLIVAAAVVLTLLAAGPAAATFPGRNGEIVLIEGSGGKYGTDGLYELLRFAPRFGEPTRRAVCGQPSYMEVKCDFLTGPAVSPDGARLAAFQYRAPTGSSPTIAPEPSRSGYWTATAHGWSRIRWTTSTRGCAGLQTDRRSSRRRTTTRRMTATRSWFSTPTARCASWWPSTPRAPTGAPTGRSSSSGTARFEWWSPMGASDASLGAAAPSRPARPTAGRWRSRAGGRSGRSRSRVDGLAG